MKEKMVAVTFWLPASLKSKAAKAAKADSRSLTKWLEKLIKDATGGANGTI